MVMQGHIILMHDVDTIHCSLYTEMIYHMQILKI